MDIDSLIDQAFKPLSDFVSSIVFYSVPIGGGQEIMLITAWLIAPALFFTIYLGFINFRYFRHAIDLVRGKHAEANADGQLDNYQALAACLAGTVGLGNIAGVAVAISIGGPGAALWMALMGLFSMSTKFCECMLAVKYRHHPDAQDRSEISGGPMYYLRDAFDNRGIPYLGHIMAIFFCVCCIGGALGGGNMFQANQTFQQMVLVTGGESGFLADKGWLFGLALAVLVGAVIIGGVKSIAKVSARIVPVMGIVYLLAGLYVIAASYANIPDAMLRILEGALAPEAGLGGFLGALVAGVQRAVFSNEAGIGSAGIVHAAARTSRPVSQGFVGMLGPFIDTVVICMVTALVIVVSGVHDGAEGGIKGIELTSHAFETQIPGARYILAFTVFLFAYSTLITWSYYGEKCATYLFGETRRIRLSYNLIFCVFVVIGSAAQLGNVIGFTDAMMFSMAIPNLIGLYLLAPEVKRDLAAYLAELRENRLTESGKSLPSHGPMV